MIKASAPGRVNLIGDHTDYNHGFVLPIAIPQRTFVEVTPDNGDLVTVESTSFPDASPVRYRLKTEIPAHDWADYVRGVTKILAGENISLSGMRVNIRSDVPVGSGLSSSAALEVALLRAFREAFGFMITDTELARLCQRVENEFVGAKVGILDPMACHLAGEHTALFLDTETLEYRRVDVPVDRADLLVISSGITHRNAAVGGYNERRSQCDEAAKLLGLPSLRKLKTLDDIPRGVLPEVLYRRVRHVLTENERVLQTVEAFERDDFKKVGEIFSESHRSLRDDYEVSIPEIDRLVELTVSHRAVFGARITGGGFGGSIVAFTEKGTATRVASEVTGQFKLMGFNDVKTIVPAYPSRPSARLDMSIGP